MIQAFLDTGHGAAVGLRAYTDKTITDTDKLKRELETTRREGISFVDEEYELGIIATGAPVWSESGNVIACVTLVSVTSRMNKVKIRKLAPKVKNCAIKISHALGYKGNRTI